MPCFGQRRSERADTFYASAHSGQYREGFGKRSPAEKARSLNIAEGSLEECRYYLILAHDLGYGQTESLVPSSKKPAGY